MKKSISLNIQGSVFLFEENASVALSNYIENLKLFFKSYIPKIKPKTIKKIKTILKKLLNI